MKKNKTSRISSDSFKLKETKSKISLDSVLDSLKKKLDSKTQEGKDTTSASKRFQELLKGVKPFRGKVLSPEIVKSMNEEFEKMSKMIDDL